MATGFLLSSTGHWTNSWSSLYIWAERHASTTIFQDRNIVVLAWLSAHEQIGSDVSSIARQLTTVKNTLLIFIPLIIFGSWSRIHHRWIICIYVLICTVCNCMFYQHLLQLYIIYIPMNCSWVICCQKIHVADALAKTPCQSLSLS